jgi:hypothetical protein
VVSSSKEKKNPEELQRKGKKNNSKRGRSS